MLIKRLLIALFLLFPAKGFAADSTVAALAAASALAGSELFYCVQSSADKKCTASQLSTFVLTAPNIGVATATSINGATFDNNAWTSYTPVVTSSTNSPPTTIGTVLGSFQTRGKTTCFQADITITTNGTATGALLISIPANSGAISPVSGLLAGTRSALSAYAGFDSVSKVSVSTAAGAYPGADGARIVVGGCYQSP